MVLAVLWPIYWMITISLKTSRDIYRVPSLFPTSITLDNYHVADLRQAVPGQYRQQPDRRVGSDLVSVLASALAAYSLVRYRYPFRRGIGRLILLAYLTPTSLLFVPTLGAGRPVQPGQQLHGLVMVYLAFSRAVLHLAADGLLPRHSARPRGAGDGRRHDPTRRVRAGAHPAVCARAGGDGHLHLHRAPGTSCCWRSSSSPRPASAPCRWRCST